MPEYRTTHFFKGRNVSVSLACFLVCFSFHFVIALHFTIFLDNNLCSIFQSDFQNICKYTLSSKVYIYNWKNNRYLQICNGFSYKLQPDLLSDNGYVFFLMMQKGNQCSFQPSKRHLGTLWSVNIFIRDKQYSLLSFLIWKNGKILSYQFQTFILSI